LTGNLRASEFNTGNREEFEDVENRRSEVRRKKMPATLHQLLYELKIIHDRFPLSSTHSQNGRNIENEVWNVKLHFEAHGKVL